MEISDFNDGFKNSIPEDGNCTADPATDHLAVETMKVTFDKLSINSLDEISSEYEDATTEQFQMISENAAKCTMVSPEKPVSPTLFENAVKVVKNLFSPAKGHGIFSLSQSHTRNSEISATKKGSREATDDKNVNPTNFKKESVVSDGLLAIPIFDNNSSVQEEGVNFSCDKNLINSTDVQDNTNDSYTTTVSLLDDSFRSTVTHFDESMQKEGRNLNQKSSPEKTYIMNASINDTLGSRNDSLNNTLKEISSSFSLDNRNFIDASDMFDNKNVSHLKITGAGDSQVVIKSADADLCHNLSENALESLSSKKSLFNEVENSKILISGIDPSVTSSMLNNSDCKSFENVPEMINGSNAIDEENIKEPCEISFSSQETKKLKNNHSSKSDLSLYRGSEDTLTERTNDADNKFSTSTIIISRVVDDDCGDASSSQQCFLEKEAEVENNFENGSYHVVPEPNLDHIDDNKVNDLKTDGNELNIDILMPATPNIQGSDCINEMCIALASQKSYTVLDGTNPDLNRPVVVDCTTEDKLCEVAHGDCTSLDLTVVSEENAANVTVIKMSEFKQTEKNSSSERLQSVDPSDNNQYIGNNKGIVSVGGVELKKGLLIPDFSENCSFTVCDSKHNLANSGLPVRTSAQKEMVFEELTSNRQTNILEDSDGSSDFTSKQNSPSQSSALQYSAVHKKESIQNTTAFSSVNLQCEHIPLQESRVSPVQNNMYMKEKVFSLCNGPGDSDLIDNEQCINFENTMDHVLANLKGLKLNDSLQEDHKMQSTDPLNCSDSHPSAKEEDKCKTRGFMGSDSELTQLIQEQFTAVDIEKIFSVVDDMPELNLSKNIVMASEQFDKSFHDKILNESFTKTNNCNDTILSTACLDYLNTINGKPTGRDFSRESLYVKFDPLIQSKNSANLLEIPEGDKENLIITSIPNNNSTIPLINHANISDPLIPVTPLKQNLNPIAPLSPLTPSSQKSESKLSAEKLNKLKELQNEILRLRELYQQREEHYQKKVSDYENEIARLTGDACVLEEKLKKSEERQKSLVRKLALNSDSLNRAKSVLEEFLSYVYKLSDEVDALKVDRLKQVQALEEERDFYLSHLEKTEQAFSDVHCKYEKCKATIELIKKNEDNYKATIEDLKDRIENFNEKINEIRGKATREVNIYCNKMNEMRVSHAQEVSRLKAQLRKTELKVQTIQEALERKIKENEELTGICDELIQGKK